MSGYPLPHDHGGRESRELRGELSRTERFVSSSEIFRQLSDPTRLRIFWLLCHGEQCVINLAALLETSSPAVSHHLRSLQESGLLTSRREGKEVYYRAADTEACALLHRTVEQVMEMICPEEATTHGRTTEEIVRGVHEYLLEHLADRITVEDLCGRFPLSPTTLKKAFKEVYGTSLAAHMKRHRMERASSLLRNTDMSISRVACAVGYESQSRFTAAFRETYGVLPRVFRRGGNESETVED